jgi:hypothetical protein
VAKKKKRLLPHPLLSQHLHQLQLLNPHLPLPLLPQPHQLPMPPQLLLPLLPQQLPLPSKSLKKRSSNLLHAKTVQAVLVSTGHPQDGRKKSRLQRLFLLGR